ncbi:Dirigent protein [Dioscorea alata]|uniref:Dirigent protein n=1 Tax=Dioscorea alata TaxID=55571 RepID=A0ACB7UUE1_DIOAL|nr:Dirigent protein [Dioscorea alata]
MNDKRMNNINVLLFLLFVLTLVSQGHAHYHVGKEKVTNIYFFFQENRKADPPTAVLVAKPKDTIVNATNILPYGATYVLNTPLTAEQDPNSEVVGQAQGLAASAGQNQSVVVFAVDYVFTSGKFKDSSVSVLSSYRILEPITELTVVGGRGKFRMASGYAIVRTIYRNITSAIVIVEYNVTVFHYE